MGIADSDILLPGYNGQHTGHVLSSYLARTRAPYDRHNPVLSQLSLGEIGYRTQVSGASEILSNDPGLTLSYSQRVMP